jgi:exodeoxyribonuclease X
MDNQLPLDTDQAKIVRVVDLESTGLPGPNSDAAICEIGWIDYYVQTGEIDQDGTTFFVDSGHPINAATRAVHHISDKDVAGAVSPKEAITFLLRGLSPTDVLCAHNAEFEKWFLGQNRRWICTLKTAYRAWPSFEQHNNQFVRYQLGFDDGLFDFSTEQAMPPHRALPDAYTTAFILKELHKEFSIEEMVEHERSFVLLPRMPMGKHEGMPFRDVVLNHTDYIEWMLNRSKMSAKSNPDLFGTARYWLDKLDIRYV